MKVETKNNVFCIILLWIGFANSENPFFIKRSTHTHNETINVYWHSVYCVRYECWKTWSSTFSILHIWKLWSTKEEEEEAKKLENMRHITIFTTIHICWGKRIKVDDNLGGPSEKYYIENCVRIICLWLSVYKEDANWFLQNSYSYKWKLSCGLCFVG